MEKKYMLRATTVLIIFVLLLMINIYFWLSNLAENSDDYDKSRYSLNQMKDFALKNLLDNKLYNPEKIMSFGQIQEDYEENSFKFDGNDLLIFLHIQKTAGTSFERFLVKKLNIDNPCVCNSDGRKHCDCRTLNGKIWLFSRYSTGWVDWACGLHADYTQLVKSRCVDYYFEKKEGGKKKRLFMTTILREPVERFISEYSHVLRGATWKRSKHFCNGRLPTPEELPMCFDPEFGWEGAGMDEFIACPYNLAFNRQTRMLADLTLVNCYNRSFMDEATRDQIILESAKKNLKNFAFFGIKEKLEESQYIFERTFGMRFSANLAEWNKSKSSHIAINPEQLKQIRQKNQLDFALYEFALNLLQRRLTILGWTSSERNHTF